MKSNNITHFLFGAIAILLVASCSNSEDLPKVEAPATQDISEPPIALDVYKRAACSCCGKWMTHADESGFKTIAHNQNDLAPVKKKYGIHAKLQSCHTSVSKEGYVFEGHIPARYIKQFLAEKPEGGKGLAVPAMPTGTPGMEFGDLFQPYKIYLLKSDGNIEVYAEINTAEEQI